MIVFELFGKFSLYSDSFGNLGMCNGTCTPWTIFEKNNLYFFKESSTGFYLSIDKSLQLVARPFNREIYQAWKINKENSIIINYRTRQVLDSKLLGYIYPKNREKATFWTMKHIKC